jgi:hypothetical protein
MQPLHYDNHIMPIIKRFAHCVVRINSKDHAPPHFHVVMNDGREAWVKIDPVEIIHGKVAAREIAEVAAGLRPTVKHSPPSSRSCSNEQRPLPTHRCRGVA